MDYLENVITETVNGLELLIDRSRDQASLIKQASDLIEILRHRDVELPEDIDVYLDEWDEACGDYEDIGE